MNKKQKEEIKNSIDMCMNRLRTIHPHLSEEKTLLNESFNKLLIEKAILKQKLHPKKMSVISKILKKIGASKRELICDYFN